MAQQNNTFKEKSWVNLYKNKFCTKSGDTTVVLKYVSKNLKKREIISYFNGNVGTENILLNQLSDSIPDFEKGKILVTKNIANITFPGTLLFDAFISKNKIMCYPFPITSVLSNNHVVRLTSDERNNYTNFNRFIDTNLFYIDLPMRKAVQLKFSSWQIGALVMPIKVYLFSSGDSSLRENIVTNTNFNGMFGYKWGKKKATLLHSQAETKIGSYTTSINALLGISKLELTSENTSQKIKKMQTTAAVSLGMAVGYQYNIIGLYVAAGADFPFGTAGQSWDFKYMPWLGFGIGIGLGL